MTEWINEWMNVLKQTHKQDCRSIRERTVGSISDAITSHKWFINDWYIIDDEYSMRNEWMDRWMVGYGIEIEEVK